MKAIHLKNKIFSLCLLAFFVSCSSTSHSHSVHRNYDHHSSHHNVEVRAEVSPIVPLALFSLFALGAIHHGNHRVIHKTRGHHRRYKRFHRRRYKRYHRGYWDYHRNKVIHKYPKYRRHQKTKKVVVRKYISPQVKYKKSRRKSKRIL